MDENKKTEINIVNNPTEAIEVISHYEEVIKTQHRVRQCIYKQGGILKIFKQNKNIINITSVNFRFKLRRTIIKPKIFKMTKKGISQCGT